MLFILFDSVYEFSLNKQGLGSAVDQPITLKSQYPGFKSHPRLNLNENGEIKNGKSCKIKHVRVKLVDTLQLPGPTFSFFKKKKNTVSKDIYQFLS